MMSPGKAAFRSITNTRSEEPAAANKLKLSLMAQSHRGMPELLRHARILGAFVPHIYMFLPVSVGPDTCHPFMFLLLHKDMK